MEGIWILIFVGVMIFKAIKKISEVKANLPKEWKSQESPPVFREVRFPWEMTDEQEDEDLDSITVQEPERSVPPRETTMAEFVMGKTMTQKAAIQSGGKVKQEQNASGEFLPLDSYSLVNGIIMAELLQPPKCKQRIQKPY